jgi:hypothetical protein
MMVSSMMSWGGFEWFYVWKKKTRFGSFNLGKKTALEQLQLPAPSPWSLHLDEPYFQQCFSVCNQAGLGLILFSKDLN